MDIGTFQLNKIIIHEVPRRRAADDSDLADMSEVESPLDSAVKNFVTDKLKTTLGFAFEVVTDAAAKSPVPGLIAALLDDPKKTDFVGVSQQMANHLYSSQTGAMSEGLLSLVDGEVDGRKCVVILKLEREKGTRFQSELVNGQRTFRLDNIEDLMLTDKTKVFKAGLFYRPDKADVQGHVSDQQRPLYAGRGVADFFLHGFLGCDFRERPHVTTQKAWGASESFFNTQVKDPVHQTKYQLALMTEMNSAANQFNPTNFASSHLLGPDRQAYLDHLKEKGVPTGAFKKDTELITRYIELMRIGTKNGLQVLGPRDAFRDRVSVKKRPQEGTVVEIKDDINRVGR